MHDSGFKGLLKIPPDGGLDSQQPRQFSAKLIFKALRGLPRKVHLDNYFGYQLQW